MVIQLLKDRGYDIIDGDEDYKYLTKMPIDSVIEENIQKLLNEKNEKMKELEHIKNESLEDTWLNELVLLEKSYNNYLDERLMRKTGEKKKKRKLKVKKSKKSK